MGGWPWLTHWRLFLTVPLNIPKSHKVPWGLGAETGNICLSLVETVNKSPCPQCLVLAPVEEAAESPTPQVEKNGPGGRKKCWLWRRNGLNSSEKAINTFVLWPLRKGLRNPGQLTPRSTWLAAGPTGHLVAKVISRGISVSVRAKSLKPQVCVFIISSFSHGLQSLAEAPGIQ